MSKYGLVPGEACYKYRLETLISDPENSQSDVWLARDQATNRRVALKVMDASFSGIPARLFEAQFGARLKHANLCEVMGADIFQHAAPQANSQVIQAPFVAIAFEFQPAGTCARLLEGPGMLRVSLVHKILSDVLAGLEYLHENGWRHNDVKPANILIGRQGEFMLTDYGIASDPASGIASDLCYKPHVSPESLAGASGSYAIMHAPSPQTDIYQLGVTAYRLLNGIDRVRDEWTAAGKIGNENPFFDKVKRGKTPDRDGYHPSVPNSLRRVVNKAMNTDVADRYHSALAMRRDVEKLYYPFEWCFDASGGMKCVKNDVTHTIERLRTHGGYTIALVKTYPSGYVQRPSRSISRDLTPSQAEQKTRSIMQEVLKP